MAKDNFDPMSMGCNNCGVKETSNLIYSTCYKVTRRSVRQRSLLHVDPITFYTVRRTNVNFKCNLLLTPNSTSFLQCNNLRVNIDRNSIIETRSASLVTFHDAYKGKEQPQDLFLQTKNLFLYRELKTC